METRKKTSQVLRFESIGFLVIIAMSWLDELWDLSAKIFGGTPSSNWHEAFIETCITVVVWACVYIMTKRVLKRLFHLEEFLRLCGWCRKVNDGEKWVSFETFFASRLGTETTHGICPDCAQRMARSEPIISNTRP